ncbi:unnamed protein product [Ascophyllum nodosum]
MSTLVDNVERFVGRMPPPSRHWRKSHDSGGFVGLKSQVKTCYMHAVLQQLFMVPGLREEILSVRIPCRKLEDFPRELVGRRVSLPQDEAAVQVCCRCRERFFTCGTESFAPSTPFAWWTPAHA